MALPDTFEEFVAEWRELEKQPRDPNLKVTCLCGKCDTTYKSPTEEELRNIWNIIKQED